MSRTLPPQVKGRARQCKTNADWPGNIRELENFIERCVIFTKGHELRVPIAELKTSGSHSIALAPRFEQAERKVIIDALKSASGQISGKMRGRRAAGPEADHAPEQDAQAKHQSC
jgi:DNA-binding NtrC family response regulator